jgi:hypothetical protein
VAPCANISLAGDVVGLEQPLDLDRLEPFAAVRDGSPHDLSGGLNVGRERVGHRRRHLRDLLDQLAMPHQVHEAAHRVVFCRVVGDAGT